MEAKRKKGKKNKEDGRAQARENMEQKAHDRLLLYHSSFFFYGREEGRLLSVKIGAFWKKRESEVGGRRKSSKRRGRGFAH